MKQAAADKKLAAFHALKNKELAELTDNDATSAFAGLAESEAIEQAAEAYPGSAPDEQEEQAPAPVKKAAVAVKHDSEPHYVRKPIVKKAVPKPHVEHAQKKASAQTSVMQDVIDQLKSGKTVAEVRAGQDKGTGSHAAVKSKAKAAAFKKKAAPSPV